MRYSPEAIRLKLLSDAISKITNYDGIIAQHVNGVNLIRKMNRIL